jgi:hypothetical protein
VGRDEVVPVEVELIEDRRRCVVAVRPVAVADPPTQAGYVRAANEAAEALVSALEDTVEQWVAAIDEHVESQLRDG